MIIKLSGIIGNESVSFLLIRQSMHGEIIIVYLSKMGAS